MSTSLLHPYSPERPTLLERVNNEYNDDPLRLLYEQQHQLDEPNKNEIPALDESVTPEGLLSVEKQSGVPGSATPMNIANPKASNPHLPMSTLELTAQAASTKDWCRLSIASQISVSSGDLYLSWTSKINGGGSTGANPGHLYPRDTHYIMFLN
ncbi:hypothetical protein N7513_011213 [Penicillium frequentans]|nr:hypothetical protein N7513_011213 [Penicillium glabrum]